MIERYIGRGLVVGVVAAGYGIWLVWRGIRNDVRFDRFGEPMISRWLYIVAGALLAAASIVYVLYLQHTLDS
ncbi:MAG: hypothetical protein H7A43_00960 [Verrucomicrobia bacterium]|nr:hypothetical protein [Verrucomicrobiota bacterium]